MRMRNEENIAKGLRHVAGTLVVGTLFLLLAGCDGDDTQTTQEPSDVVALSIDVAQSDWTDEQATITTRSTTTLDGLKEVADIDNPADGEGFCLHGMNLLGPGGVRRQVVWNATTGQWNSGKEVYWKRTSEANTFNVYAYAPYRTTAYTYEEVTAGESSAWNAKITFPTTAADANGTNTDLLYAYSPVSMTDGRATLTFRHAMAKISFGTITNNTGESITLSSLTLTGSLWHGGKLNLKDGSWSDQTAYAPATKSFSRNDFDPSSDGNQTLALADNEMKSLNIASFVLIPGPTVTIALNFTSGDTFSFPLTLQQGKHKTYNLIVRKNFEVEIE